jgi:hypothetical protein
MEARRRRVDRNFDIGCDHDRRFVVEVQDHLVLTDAHLR